MRFVAYMCPLCRHREEQPEGAIVHHPCPQLPVGHRKPRLARLLPVDQETKA